MKEKVLLFGKLPPPYMGPAVATQILLKSRLRERYEVLHVDTNVHESLDTIGEWGLDKVGSNIRIYRETLRLLRKERPKLAIVPISQATIGFVKDSVFILMCKMMGSRVLLQLRGSNLRNWLDQSSPVVRSYVERLIRMSDGVVVLGANLRPLFERYFEPDRIYVVPNGADYDIPGGGERSSDVRLLYLANLQPSKGIEDVVRGAKVLKEKGVAGFRIDVVGAWRDEGTRHTCEALVREHELPVTFHGPAYDSDKFAFMARADAFVFTPREPEGHPWVIVEALASGLPIISTDQGAIRESVAEGVNGFIVESHNPEQLAERMRRLIEDPELRRTQSAASRRRYEENFTEEKMVEQLSHAIDRALGHPPRRGHGRPALTLTPTENA